MRELDMREVEAVSGGIMPIIGFGAAMAGHYMVRTAGAYAVSRLGTISGTYGLATYLGRDRY